MDNNKSVPQADFVFEVSWEVCNKVGGIYTVISTKAPLMKETYGDNFILIGPDIYKGKIDNHEFVEDVEICKQWREQFNVDGLKVRIGRWNIPSQPIAILVDFSPLFAKKNEIFDDLWKKNQLDSITGGWNYIEPAMFGYAAGKIIENFKSFYAKSNELIIAHFHEWMTGTGLLYLENTVPEVATVFTTHATATGRAICGNGLPFYSKFDTYNGDEIAKRFNMVAMNSLEKIAAISADAFTTVSDNTAKECEQLLGKAVDKVTINGFDDSFIPLKAQFEQKRTKAKKKLLKIASSVIGYKAPEDSLLVATSGRYEYENKGIDVFIDALAALNSKNNVKRNVIAFILIPAAHTLPKPSVLKGIENENLKKGDEPAMLTHYLQDAGNDKICTHIKAKQLSNEPDDTVKIIFAPIYLDGNDGVFNMSYYDVLIGFDLTVFPSYYEPFGYTPLESLAFHIPTLTTTLTGFGKQVKSLPDNFKEGMMVAERDDFNHQTVIEQIANFIYEFSEKNTEEIGQARKQAFEISRHFLWKNLIENYREVYEFASKSKYIENNSLTTLVEKIPTISKQRVDYNNPIWKSSFAKFKIPKALKDLEILGKNLWWTWHPQAEDLFASIDYELWEKTKHNPLALLSSLKYEQFEQLKKDKVFLKRMKHILKDFYDYMVVGEKKNTSKIAYLCMEYGLHESLPIYSGGLGILAGDYLKEASDKNMDMVAFGLLYRFGYFKQNFNFHGDQISEQEKLFFTQLPIEPVMTSESKPLILQLPFRGPKLSAKVWKVSVGRIPLYLFDTDIPENSNENKSITHQLYGGNSENRFKQEILLAANAVQLIENLELKPDIYHFNEGHTAFTGLVRILNLVVNKNLSFDEAKELVKASTLFTTHTPVAAGHDTFSENILRSYQSHVAKDLNVPWELLLGLGRINAYDQNEKFSMSYLAANMSSEINAVSDIHAGVTRNMFQPLWKGIPEEELDIKNVTNGVHYASWTSQIWQQLFKETFGEEFTQELSNEKHWKKIKQIPANKIADVKNKLKRKMIEGIKNRLKFSMKNDLAISKSIYETLNNLDEKDLIIGFARRFATYKRANLLFKDTQRLSKLVNNPDRPLKLIFAGKAHPADKSGQDLIKHIIELSKMPEFLGKLLFIPNYDMALGRLLTQGVDVWLNTPERGREASGTSGMKALLNGTLNFSVLDGWWAEGYVENTGWALPRERMFTDQKDQDDLDAESIYHILENEIIPEYFELNSDEISEKWIERIKNSFIHITPRFIMTRMMEEYKVNYYDKIYTRIKKLKSNDYKELKDFLQWKHKINKHWDEISVIDIKALNNSDPLYLGEPFSIEVILNLNAIDSSDIGVELVFAKHSEDGSLTIQQSVDLPLVEEKNHKATYKGSTKISFSGAFKYGIRYFPKNYLLNHKRDLPLIKWI